jgi:hypothetical protein
MSLNVLGVISRALQIMGKLGGGATPAAQDAADALIAFNAMKRAWFGTLIGPRLTSYPLSGTTGQAENGGEYQIPGGAVFTLTAPGNPKPGARFGAVDASLGFASYPLTIARNGQLIAGSASNYTLSTAGQNTRWWFRPDTGSWTLEADSASLTSAIEFPDHIIAYMPYLLCMALSTQFAADLPPEVIAAAGEGRSVLARMYGRRGRGLAEGPLGLPQLVPAQG